MENREIASLLSETADLMEIASEDSFRIRSYRNAASAIDSYPERVADIAANPARKLTEIQSVGKGIAFVIAELLERGSFEKRDQLLARYPPTALELLKIQGLGPKSIALLFEHFRVSTIDDLERLCKEQKLRTLPRMGAKLEEKVLRSIEEYRGASGKYLLSFARRKAAELIEYLAAVPGVDLVTPAGSVRRGRETVADLDLLVTGRDAAAALTAFGAYPGLHVLLGSGPNKASGKVGLEGLQVDVRALPPESFGAAMQYFTGSKEHNVLLRQRALKLGYTLNEYGLFRLENATRVAGQTEEEIYEKLGLSWIPPELRENCGEIEAAAERQLPTLIQLPDIRGDLHMHTRETDGRATLEEMAGHCRDLGYEYIAITDHSKALSMANGLDEQRVVAFARRVREINENGLGIRILSGLECDILKDGAMDIADEALAELDFVVGSVHSHMKQEPAEMTDRLLRALENPHIRVLGHPTGRILLHRDAYGYDFEKIAAAAATNRVALEVNASPERLDLHGPLLRTAKSKAVKFTISTDAHHPKHLSNMHYGVLMARRGWLTPSDVLNTLPLDKFLQAIEK
ncbi:MAG TPA: DNA polymerase/3'-5' exonuclease PolX [Bryobacteraceae bacterium]|nr:DNA polymerase/3'-5' exonuclease PolX [Bryobacteraceae bacterium]